VIMKLLSLSQLLTILMIVVEMGVIISKPRNSLQAGGYDMTDDEIDAFNQKQVLLERNKLLIKQLNMGRNYAPSLEAADRVLVVGHCDTVHGNAYEYGFVSTLRESLKYKYENMTFDSLGICHDDHDSFLKDFRDGPLSSFQPTVAMLFFGHEILPRDTSARADIERIVAHFARVTPKILVSGLFGHHQVTLQQTDNQRCENWNDALRQIAKEYEVYFLDLWSPLHQLRSQTGSHDQILSYDGYRLNELGHKIVAKHVLHAFGLSTANSTNLMGEMEELHSAAEDERTVQEQFRSLADVQPIE